MKRQQQKQLEQQQQQFQQQKHLTDPSDDVVLETHPTTAVTTTSLTAIDDEIERLERELQQYNDDDDDDDDEDNDDDDESDYSNEDDVVTGEKRIGDSPRTGTGTPNDDINQVVAKDTSETDADSQSNNMIVCISESNQTPIEHLPKHCLPDIHTAGSSNNKKNTNKKRKRNNTATAGSTLTTTNSKASSPSTTHAVGTGLRQAVQEMMQQYQRTEKVPFYCRYCTIQCTDLQQFQLHQTTAQHKTNVKVHNTASYCTICRKQFTSPIQYKEHIQSKPHFEQIQRRQNRKFGKPSQPQQQQSKSSKWLNK